MYVLENWSNWLRVYANRDWLKVYASRRGFGKKGVLHTATGFGPYPVGATDVQIMGCCNKTKLLMIMTSTFACISFALLVISVATGYWLYAIEQEVFPNNSFYYRHTTTGLWRKCHLSMDSYKKLPGKKSTNTQFIISSQLMVIEITIFTFFH